MSFSTALSDLKILLSSLGLDPSKFGEHAGRRGGAASDAGVDWPDLMTHGRWKSVAIPLGYLANSRRRQRRVANALSLASSSASSLASSISAVSAGSSTIVVPTHSTPHYSSSSQTESASTAYFQSNADWVQVKRRYTGNAVPVSDPIPLPPPSTQERLAAEALASLIDSPP